MPRVVRWYLRTALEMFVLALLAGVVQAIGSLENGSCLQSCQRD